MGIQIPKPRRTGLPKDFMGTVHDGGMPWRVPYSLFVPPEFWDWLREREGEEKIKAFRRDYGQRQVTWRSKGKPPWDQPWGDPPTDEEVEKELWSKFSQNPGNCWPGPRPKWIIFSVRTQNN